MKSRLCSQRFSSFLRIFLVCALLFASSFFASAQTTWSGNVTDTTIGETNKVITLIADTSIESLVIKATNVVIDLNGYNLSITQLDLGGKYNDTSPTSASLTLKNSGSSGSVTIKTYDVANTATTSLMLEGVSVTITDAYYLDTNNDSTSISGTGELNVESASNTAPDGKVCPLVTQIIAEGSTIVVSEKIIDTYYWTGGGDGSSWTNSKNWSDSAGKAVPSGTYPGFQDGDTAVFDLASASNITGFTVASENYSLTINNKNSEQAKRIYLYSAESSYVAPKNISMYGYISFYRVPEINSLTVNANGYAQVAGLTVKGDILNKASIWASGNFTCLGKVTNDTSTSIINLTGNYEISFNEVDNAGTINIGISNLSFSGSVIFSGDVNNTGTITGQYTTSAVNTTFGGKFTNNKIFTGGSGSITFNGDVENNYTIDCGSGTVTFKDNYVNGSINTNEALIQASSADTIFYKNVDFSSTSASNFMHNSGTVKFLGESAKVITTDTLTFNNVSIDSGKLEIAGDVIVSNKLSMTGGTSLVVDSGKTLSLTQFSDEGTSVCKLEINGTLKPSVDTAATMTLNNVDVTVGSTGVISGSNVTADLKDVSTLTNSGSVTLKSITNAKTITNEKTISCINGNISASEIVNNSGAPTNTYSISGGNITFGAYSGDGSILSYGLTITSTSSIEVTIDTLYAFGQVTCSGIEKLTIDTELKTSTSPFKVTEGSLTVNGTSNINGDITTGKEQTYNGTATINANSTLTSDGKIDFADVEISSGKTLTFGGTGYDVTVSGNWTNNGTVVANESTVTFTDTATISGDTTFYNLSLDAGGKTLTVEDAQSVSGTLNLSGQAGSLLSLSGSGHFIANASSFSGEYLSIGSSVEIWKTGTTAATAGLFAVSDSEASVSSDSETVFAHGWKIGDMAFVWTGALSTAWATAGNWKPAIVPGTTGSEGVDVVIPDGVTSGNYPVAAVSYSLKSLSVGSSIIGGGTHNATLTLSGANNINITDAASPLVNYGTIVYQSSGRLTDGTSAINDTANAGTIEYAGTSQTIAAVDYANLIVSGTATATDAITVLGDCTISGSADFQKSLDVSGTLSLSGTGTNQFNSSGGAITSTIASFECAMTGGSVQIGSVGDTASTFKVTSSTLSLPSALSSTIIGGTVECASQTYNCLITLTGQPTTFKGTTVTFAGAVLSNSTPPLSYGLKVDGNAVFKADVTSSGDIEVTGTTKTQGASVTVDAKGSASTNGRMTLSGAVVLGATSTTFKSIDDMTFGSTIDGSLSKSNAVMLSAKSALLGTAKPISVTGALGSSVPLGAFSVDAGTLSVGGDFGAKSLSIASASTFKAAASSTVTLSGNFSNSGTFTHNNSTVVFSDTAVISGSTTFYDLKATTGGKTLSVSGTQTVLNTLSLKGADGNLLGISGSGTLVCSESNFSAEYLTIGGDIKIAENASSVVAGVFTAENSVPMVGVSVSAVFNNGWKLSNDLAIIETIAVVGSNKIALMFNSMLYSDTGSLLTKSADLSSLSSEMSIEAANSEIYDVESATLVSNSENSAVILLEISSRITLDDVKEGFIVMNATSTAFFGEGNRTLSSGTKHCVSHFVAGAVEVLYAKAKSSGFDSDAYTVRDFSKDAGKEGRIFFSDEDGYKITVATHIASKADANGNLDFTADFDDSLLLFAKKSTPSSSDLSLFKNTLGIKGQTAGASYLKNFSLDFSSASLSTCVSGDTVEFMFALASSDGSLFKRSADTKTDIALPVLRLVDPSDIKSLDTWRFTLSAIKAQRGGVTILNNVINSRAKEKTTIVVDTEKSTSLKVYVMTLDGSIVRTFEKSRVKSGRHTYTWDGTNGAGKSVARGMYFVRVIADDIDETRKVMVVKE